MASQTLLAVAIIALAVCPVIFSAPTTKQTCAPVCNERRQSVLKYEEGKTYVYNFDTEVVTQLVGSTDETSKIKVKGQAAVAAQSPCDLVLTVQQIAITSSSGQAISRVSDIEGSSIRFGFNDGVIDSVCVAEDDPTWSANIKRAIVSMLGNRALNGDTEAIETDVNGKCKTTYQISGNKYTKTKDLASCTNRDGGMANVYGVPYTAPSKYHSIPVFNSVLSCVQELGKGIVQNVECTEGHSLDVIQSTGVRTDIKSSLSLANVLSEIVKGRNSNKVSSLLYDFNESDDVQKQKSSASNSVEILNKICKEVEGGTVSLKVPGLFLQLRKTVRSARRDDLKHMYQQITSGKLCQTGGEQLKKIYLDAAALSAGDGPISFLAEVIASGQAQETTKDTFLVSAVFASHPGPLALEAVETLVSRNEADSEYLLAATGLAHQYCRMTNPKCGSNDKYISLVNKVAQHVKVATDEESVEKLIVALQALGNLDSLTPNAVTALVSLIEDSKTCQRVKVRALDAFRRDPCQETLKKKALKIFSDVKESSQVRIQAYLTASKCFVAEDVSVVQAVIDSDDESNQVGSFVVSHIYNMVESSSPSKEPLKKLFQSVKLRDFPSDFRKFSRNIEFSAFEPSLMNSGLSFDSNVIFSQDSYIPRCSNANFTVDAFGRSYNLMEFGLCLEEFEDLVERFLGPESPIRSVTLDDIVRESADKLNKLKAGISNRFKRDASEQIDQNEIAAIKNEVDIHTRTGDNANGDVYVRVLGTSILAESFSKSGLKNNPLASRILRDLFAGVQDQNVAITEPFMFMDDEIIFPTSSGLPLTVQTEGTSVLSFQMQGNLDVTALIRGNNGDMRAKVMPSAATVVKAKMVLGSGPIESGLQVEGKIHSAAGIDLKVVREDGKFELRVNIPQEKIQVFDIRSDIYWVEQSIDQLEKKTPMKTKTASRAIIDNQCTSHYTKDVGLKVCADVKIPQTTSSSPVFFLNGPSVVSLFVEKMESSMEGYYLKVESIKGDDTYGVDMVLDTPGSRTNRKVTAQARTVGPRSATPQYSLKLESPSNNLEVNYKRSFTDDLKGVELKVTLDGDSYTGLAELRKAADGNGYKLTPVVQYQLPNGNPVKLVEGEITRVPGQNLNVQLKTGGPFRATRGSVKGQMIITRNEADHVEIEYKDLEFKSEALGKVLLGGSIKQHGKVYDFTLDSEYGQTAQHKFSIDAKVGSPTAQEKILKVVTRSSRRELLNFDLDWSFKKGDNSMEHKLEYTRGLTEPKVVIKQESEIKIISRREFDIESELTVKHPTYGIDFHAEAEAESQPGQERKAKLEFKLGEGLKAEAKYSTSNSLADYKILGNLVVGEKSYEVSEVSTKVNDNERKFKTRLAVQPGFYYEADTDVLLKLDKQDFKSEVSTVVTSDKLENPITLKSTVVGKKDSYEALLKLDAQGKKYLDLHSTHKVARESGNPASYSTSMKAHVLNIVDAKLSNTYSNGNGDFVLDALLVKSGRKIAATSKVSRAGDVFDLKADFKWDAERDATKAVSLKSSTTLSFSELRLDSKNDITVIDKTAKVNLRGSLAREVLNGENTAEIDYVSPNGKTYSLASKLDLEIKQTVRAAKLHLNVARPDVQPSELDFGFRASNFNQQDGTFDIKTDLKANYRQEKDVSLHAELSSTHPGNYRSYAGSFSAVGSAIPKPVAFTVKTDVKSGRLAIKAETTKGPQGEVIGDLDATIDFDYASPKKTFGAKYTITTPIERIKSLQGEFQGAYMYNSFKNFEVSQLTSLTLNGGSPYSTSYALTVLENEAKYNYKYISEGKPVVTLAAEGKYDRRHLKGSLNSDFRGSLSKLNLDVEHGFPNFALTFDGETALVEGIKNFELKLSNKKNEDGSCDSEVLAKSDGEDRFRLTNKYENTPQKKFLEVVVAAGDEPIRKVSLLFNEAQVGKWNVEASAKWGDGGKYLNTKGSLTKQNGGLEGELSLDSPHFQANKFNVRVSKKLVDGRHDVDISVDGNNKRQLAIGVQYAAQEKSSYERSYDGSLKIEGQAVGKPVDFTGKFHLDDTKLDRQRDNGEEGRSIRAAVEVNYDNNPMKVNVLAKSSNKENRVKLSLCDAADANCRIGDIHWRHTGGPTDDNGDLHYEFRITSEKTGTGQRKNGIVFQTMLGRHTPIFEHGARLIINEEKAEQIGYRIYRAESGKETGGEILLPARVIALVATSNRPSTGGYTTELAFFIDKTKKADRKISMIWTASERTTNADKAHGRQVELIFRHPDLTKDLKMTSRYAYGGEVTFLELETVLDVLTEGHEISTKYTVTKPGESSYKTAFAILSSGLHINFKANSEVTFAGKELSYHNVLTYENSEKQVKTAQVLLGVSKQRFNFEIDGPDAKFVSFVSAYESHPNGCEIRYEVHLPGMEDTRIVRTIANTVSPRSVQVKTFTSASPKEEYYEAFLGFRSNDELAAGVYDHSSATHVVLADVNLALNGSRILSVKSNWNKDNIRSVLTKAQERGEKHGERLRNMITKAIEEVAKEARHVGSNIRSAAPNLKVIFTSGKDQLAEIKQELEANPDTKIILDQLSAARGYFVQFTRFVVEVARTLRRIAGAYFTGLRESLKALPEKYNEVLQRIPEYIESLKVIFNRGVDALINFSRVAFKTATETFEQWYSSLPPLADMWNWVIDHTEGLRESLTKVIQKVSEKLAIAYSAFRSLAEKIMANRTVKAFLAELSTRIQGLLEEFVQDTKEYAETFKNYILNAVPQKEFQAFVEALADYIQKKASKSAVDDAAALNDIYTKLKATIKQAAGDIFTLDPQKGIFRARIPLPVSLKGLSEFTKVFSLSSAPQINFRVPAYTYGLRELINQLRSGAAVNELLPPFKGYALLIGSKHYKTFDGRFFDFEGSCQYLLASDFEDGNFTVVADYFKDGGVTRKNILVTDGQATVALKPDHTVNVNGQQVTLDNSKEAGSLLIERLGDWIVVRGKKGAVVGCAISEDVCAVKVDGFYHGKVLGMLGKLNLERFDDLSKPNGEITHSVGDFAASWKLNKQCAEPTVYSIALHATASAEQKCQRFLDSRSSSLRPCYGVVDPTPFRNVCEKLSQKPGYTEEKAVCTASIGYAKACYMSYAKVDAVPACTAA